MAAVKLLPKDVADAFVRQYYTILDGCPENLHRFYQESSLLSWPGPDGNMSPVTTATGISNKVLASDHIKGLIDVKTVDTQNSIDGALIVVVTGSVTLPDMKKNFSHTFFLAKQTKGFYVLNDILRYFDVLEMTKVNDTDCADRSDQAGLSSVSSPGKNNQPDSPSDIVDVAENYLPASPSATTDAAKNHLPVTPSKDNSPRKDSRAVSPAKQKSGKTVSSDTKAAVENSKAKEVVTTKATAGISAATPSADSAQTASEETPTPVAAPLVNFNIKISYASMVAKDVPVLPPTNAQKQTKPSPPPPTNTVPKATALGAAAKESVAASGKGNGATSGGANGEAVKHIYIGRLPYEITKQEIVKVIKQFGAVRRGSDSVQIKRHEDGFCCCFVEFESADAARRAVEAHHVQFGDGDSSYIAYKRSSRDSGGGSRSPVRSRNGSRGREMEPARKGRAQNGGRRGA